MKTLVTDKDEAIAKLAQQLQALDEQFQQVTRQKDERIRTLEHQVDWFKRQIFGQKSEKRNMQDNPHQQTIADVLKELPKAPESVEQEKQTITYQRGKAPKDNLAGTPDDSGLRFDESVPVKEISLSAPELDGPEADQYEIIGQKTTYRLAQQPGSQIVLKYTRPVIKKKSTKKIITTAAPANVLDKSFADVSFLAGMLTDKFLYHLPLYRQHQRLEMNGIKVARSTLTNLTKRAIELLRPVYEAQLKHLLRSTVLAMDETPIKAGRKKKGKMHQAWFWPIFGEEDEVCFTFSAVRGMQHIVDQLGDYSGTLITDGYAAYEKYDKKNKALTHASCWVHCRRTFEKAENSEPQASAIALAYIGELYKHERWMADQGYNTGKKQHYRTENSLPVVEAFFKWCFEQRQRIDLIPSDPLSQALEYTRKREEKLKVFFNDPNVPMDTNHLERELRVIPMGRKNWNFCWTEIGAEHVGIIQSLLVTCKLHNVNPYEYLVDVLQRISVHPATDVEDLTPRVWKDKFASDPMRSALNC